MNPVYAFTNYLYLWTPSHLCLGSELFINLPSLTFVTHLLSIYKNTFWSCLQAPVIAMPFALTTCSESSSQKPSHSILGMKDQVSQPHKTTRTHIHSCIQNNSFNLMSDNPAVEQSSPKTMSFAFYQKKRFFIETDISGTCSERPPRMCLHINHCSISWPFVSFSFNLCSYEDFRKHRRGLWWHWPANEGDIHTEYSFG